MTKKLWVTLVLLGLAGTVAPGLSAASRANDISRIQNSAQVFREIMSAPDKNIPHNLLQSARCVAIVPSDVKFAFFLGGDYGKGLATCRTGNGWSAPVFLKVEGGSFGFQFGGSSTDIVLLFMNNQALQHLLQTKFKLGAGASVAAGPVGRSTAAATDIGMHAEILSYSRSRGIFAGVSLNGNVVKADSNADRAMYGTDVTRQEIIDGKEPAPAAAKPLVHELAHYSNQQVHTGQ